MEPINLNFSHLCKIFIVFFITVYGKIPNMLIAVVSSGFIKLFGFASQSHLDVLPKRKNSGRICLGKHAVREC